MRAPAFFLSLLVFCAIACAGALRIHDARAEAGWSASATKVWRYHVTTVSRSPTLDASKLNDMGAAGWELVAVSAGRMYFKAPR